MDHNRIKLQAIKARPQLQVTQAMVNVTIVSRAVVISISQAKIAVVSCSHKSASRLTI